MSKVPTTTFHESYPLDQLRPADYNPRRLSDTAFIRLQASLRRHGVVKPVILNADGTLVAGHQRTKGLKAIGLTHTPAVMLGSKVRLQDEIQFNLLHNRVETEASVVYADPGELGAWSWIPWQSIRVAERKNLSFVNAIGHMAAGHGPWGSVVIDDQGRIVLNAEYAVVASINRFDLLAWTVPSSEAAQLHADLTGEYGVYDWTAIEGKAPVWNQHIVQPKRLRQFSSKAKAGKLAYGSETWDQLVTPWLKPSHRVVDFGAGYGDYAKHLRAKGFNIHDYEPYRCRDGSYAVDIRAVVGMLRDIDTDIQANGLYDVVVLDSVINATTTLDYQHWVLTTVNALCAADGVVCLGTRNLARELRDEQAKRVTSQTATTKMSFLDEDNVEMNFVKGKWQKLRFHTPDTLEPLLRRYFEDVKVTDLSGSNIKATCRRPIPLPKEEYERAFEEEFNMPYPNGFRHDRHLELVGNLIKLVKERNCSLGI
ncbi:MULTISPECIES: methyltransferase domain-containing protein [unclassified Streptomyces]|uniref:methyltransferase domain-containing protein n=1 Tax=unclassified Streptomyces TaxID=2593676 RepID=UPI001E4F0E06|nr:methyltransferase domain-containing protein [Streptomyces sp. CB02980]MCB8906742.1 methyltransferase domain-containing protein [Streptomyces sp. CB02980]